MNILMLQEKVLNLRSELETIINTGEAETRELAENETNRLAEIRSEIEATEKQISDIEEENRKLSNNDNNNIVKTERKMERVNLVNLINAVVEGRALNENEAKYVNGRTISTRAINASTKGEGLENVPTDEKSLDVAIRNASVLTKMGARWFSNAVGDVQIPRYSGSEVLWKGEVAAADNGEGEFTETILKPKRLTAEILVSRQFLLQDRNQVEAMLIRDLAEAVAEKFDKTIMGSEEGTDNKPAGLFAEATKTAVADIDFDTILGLEKDVEEKNGTDFIFVTNPAVKYQLRGVQTASGLQMVYNAGEIDGQKTIVSNSVDGVACICPKDLAIATWGNTEITVDPYTQIGNGMIRLVVNAYMDGKLAGDRIAVLGLED